jgi:dihydroorotate dehydrogenase (fumarate)
MLATKIGAICLDGCIYNASGPRTNSDAALIKIAESGSACVLSKSATLKAQDGNPLPRSIPNFDLGTHVGEGSVNSEGLPNYGIDYYLKSEMVSAITKTHNKPYIVSLSGLSLEDNVTMIKKVLATEGVSGIELNLACPNVPGKPIIAYDFPQMDTVLSTIHKELSKANQHNMTFGVKLAPYFDKSQVEQAIKTIVKYPSIQYIVSINTIGNALFVNSEHECASITGKGGYGGLGGGYVKHTALANIHMLYTILQENNQADKKIEIVGVGGISTGNDAFQAILCGASAIQIATCHWNEGGACFERISNELSEIMKSKKYSNINDFKGKLKVYEKHRLDKSLLKVNIESKVDLSDTMIEYRDVVPGLFARDMAIVFLVLVILALIVYYNPELYESAHIQSHKKILKEGRQPNYWF